MTRRPPLRVLLPNTVSHAAMDFVGHPFIFSFGLGREYQDYREAAWQQAKPLSFLAWVNLWIRLALGLEVEAHSLRADFIKFDVPRIRPRQVKTIDARRHAAQNLEALMRFVPGAGRGLTLNQYRERFTRLSVLGRVQIYAAALRGRFSLRRNVKSRLDVFGAIGFGRAAICAAPIWPD